MTLSDIYARAQKRLYRYLNPRALDLAGDREVEYAFVAAHVPDTPGTALDFGCGNAPIGLVAAFKGYTVLALDLTPVQWTFVNPAITFHQADINTYPLGSQRFDVILTCSTVEHVGLAGRYGSLEDPNGDLKAMRLLRTLLKPGGRMLLTIPVGQDQVCRPYHRIYGAERLQHLLEGYVQLHVEYWLKRPGMNRWVNAPEAEALAVRGGPAFYALGLFVLTLPK